MRRVLTLDVAPWYFVGRREEVWLRERTVRLPRLGESVAEREARVRKAMVGIRRRRRWAENGGRLTLLGAVLTLPVLLLTTGALGFVVVFWVLVLLSIAVDWRVRPPLVRRIAAVGRRERCVLARAAAAGEPGSVERLRAARERWRAALEAGPSSSGSDRLAQRSWMWRAMVMGFAAIVLANLLGMVWLPRGSIGIGFVGLIVASAVARDRASRRFAAVVRGAVDGQACADCGYALAGTGGEGVMGELGPRRCPECGERWPCVPPEVQAHTGAR